MIKFNNDDDDNEDNGGDDDDDDDDVGDDDDSDDNEYDGDDGDGNGNQEPTGLDKIYVKFKIGIFCMFCYELKTNLNKPCACHYHHRCKYSFHSVL